MVDLTRFDVFRVGGRRHRRMWVAPGRAHVEVRTASRPGSEALARRVKRAVEALDGVHWAEVNGVVGRLVVAFDDGEIDFGEVVEAVEAVEDAAEVNGEPFSFERSEHPGDGEAIRRAQLAIAADFAGMGFAVFGTLLRATPIPVELASLVSLIDSQPRVRRVLENRLGPTATDVGLSVGNAIGQGLAQGPLGLLVDAAYRASVLATALENRRGWEKHELVWGSNATQFASTPISPRARPLPVPRGPIESFADRAALASMAAAAATFAATRSPRRASAMLLAGMAKPARYGREGFVTHVGRLLARRGVVVMDQTVLRTMDRVDALVMTADLVVTGCFEIDQVEVAAGEDHLQVHARLRTMFDPVAPDRTRRSGGWRIGGLDDARYATRDEASFSELTERFGNVDPQVLLALNHRDRCVAVFSVAHELDPGARQVVVSAAQAGHMTVLAGGDAELMERVGADVLVDGGIDLAENIRNLQSDGCVVALVAGHVPEAHRAADCGIGVARDDVIPWGAHIIAANLDDARFIVEAAVVAHEVSRQSAALGLIATSAGSFLALMRPAPLAASAVSTTINAMSLVALGNGTRAAAGLAKLAPFVEGHAVDWHELTASEALDEVDSSPVGLSETEARKRRVVAPDALPAPLLFAQAVAEELVNPLTPVLAAGALASAALGSTADALIVGGVTALNSLIGGTQRFVAQRAVNALTELSAPMVHVRRGGAVAAKSVDELVVGDIVVLEAGDTVPADCRLLEGTGVEVDEAALTGESVPVSKSPEPVFASMVAERTSMIYEGTTLVAGSLAAVVVAVGIDTEAAADFGGLSSPTAAGVEAHLGRLTALAIPVAAIGGAAVVAAGLLHGRPLRSSLASGVSLAVAAVPEGLPMVATMAQLAAARRLSKRGALVRNPRAMEALGRVDVLCTDKTGTLTQGRIQLQQISDGDTVARIDELEDTHRVVLAAALRACPPASEHRRLAHPTDQAVLDGAAHCAVDVNERAPGWERLHELPFDPTSGFHATLARTESGAMLSVKGAPEIVLPGCIGQQRGTMTRVDRRRLETEVDRLAREGLRVLAVAERVEHAEGELNESDINDLTFLGFLAFADPVRPTAAAAINGLGRAGVAVVMVTGDHPSTAEGIAAELGLLNGHRVITGSELDRLTASELAAILPEVSVFARVSPADKVRIVAAYQHAGHTVAMTGDGANDAPAIRLADAGIALGARCTPAARLASDVVITDDRIETIVDAIIEGRAMWRSVRDALAILLGGNLGEIGFTLAATALTGTSPLSTRQVLIVNLLTDVAPAIAIATRAPNVASLEDLISEGPDQSLGASLNRAIAARAATTALGATAAWGAARLTGGPKRAGTVGLAAVVGTQLGQTLVSGGRDPRVIGAAIGSTVVLVGIIQTPGVSQYFGCTPLDPVAWSIAIGSATAATALGALTPAAIHAIAGRLPGQLLTPDV